MEYWQVLPGNTPPGQATSSAHPSPPWRSYSVRTAPGGQEWSTAPLSGNKHSTWQDSTAPGGTGQYLVVQDSTWYYSTGPGSTGQHLAGHSSWQYTSVPVSTVQNLVIQFSTWQYSCWKLQYTIIIDSL